jgi:predicted transposase YbfD/YdcC
MMRKQTRAVGILGNLEHFLEDVPTLDPYRGYKFKTKDILTIAVLGLICGMTTMKMIHRWATSERVRDFLREQFCIPFVPCYSQFTVILGNIDSRKINFVFMEWARSMAGDVAGKTIAIDGKTIRSTEKILQSPLNIVSAYITEMGLILGQIAVDGKKNEIPCAKELLDLLNVEGAIIVADALHCQRETAQKIVQRKADYLLSVKKNQRKLFKEIQEFFERPENQALIEKHSKTEKNSGRIERRTAFASLDVSLLPMRKNWAKLGTIGAIHTEFEKNGKKTSQWHYYISSAELSPETLLEHARFAWGVESMYWLLDVHFSEDTCTAQDENTQFALNILRKTVLNLLKQYKTNCNIKQPISGIMADCLFDCNKLLDVLCVLVFLAIVAD